MQSRWAQAVGAGCPSSHAGVQIKAQTQTKAPVSRRGAIVPEAVGFVKVSLMNEQASVVLDDAPGAQRLNVIIAIAQLMQNLDRMLTKRGRR